MSRRPVHEGRFRRRSQAGQDRRLRLGVTQPWGPGGSRADSACLSARAGAPSEIRPPRTTAGPPVRAGPRIGRRPDGTEGGQHREVPAPERCTDPEGRGVPPRPGPDRRPDRQQVRGGSWDRNRRVGRRRAGIVCKNELAPGVPLPSPNPSLGPKGPREGSRMPCHPRRRAPRRGKGTQEPYGCARQDGVAS